MNVDVFSMYLKKVGGYLIGPLSSTLCEEALTLLHILA